MIALTIITLAALFAIEFLVVQRNRRATELPQPDLRSVPTGPFASGLQPIRVESAREQRVRSLRSAGGDLPPAA